MEKKTIEKVLTLAIKGGYRDFPKATEEGLYFRPTRYGKNTEFKMWQSYIFLDVKFWKSLMRALGFTGEKIRMCTGCGVTLRNNENPTMDGKHGDRGYGSDIYEYDGMWLVQMHQFIDYLAEGRTAEAFFTSLLRAKNPMPNLQTLLDAKIKEFDEKFPIKDGLFNTESGWAIKNADPKILKSLLTSAITDAFKAGQEAGSHGDYGRSMYQKGFEEGRNNV